MIKISIYILFILGFGSTRHEIILAAGVHYDCGCLFSENGDLIHFPNNRGNGGALSVPAVYVAYFSTFGAMVRLYKNFLYFYFSDFLGMAFIIIRYINSEFIRSYSC
jgi:hypothetical protein